MRSLCALVFGLCLFATAALAEGKQENFFGTIEVDCKKIGQVHYTVSYNEAGEVENLKTRASLSILGVKLYSFSQDLEEDWNQGELQTLEGHTNDDGKTYDVTLRRNPEQYNAVLNDKPVTLPHDAFPISLWHYGITEQTLLFDLSDLTLMTVKIAKSQETIKVGGKSVAAERFEFTGDWKGKVWFDEQKMFLQAKYETEGRQVLVTLDPQ